jgi:hypothetical protein
MDDYPENIQTYLRLAAQTSPNRLMLINLHFFGYCPLCDAGNPTQ